METTHKITGRAQRDREFMELFHHTLDVMLAAGVPQATEQAARFTIANGSPHYPVGHERACMVVRQLLRHPYKGQLTVRQQMWTELTERVRWLIGCGVSLPAAVELVLTHCRASCFHLSLSTATTHICTRANVRRRALR